MFKTLKHVNPICSRILVHISVYFPLLFGFVNIFLLILSEDTSYHDQLLSNSSETKVYVRMYSFVILLKN